MAQIFISHSSRDPDQASRVLDWLHANGFAETFLDFDKHAGFAAGADWERSLYREMADAEVVLLIVTSNWFDSKWCFAEFTQARALGKAIFPLLESPAGEGVVSPDIQNLDLITNREDALSRLLVALNEIVLNSRGGFDWDQSRPPYPGLLALDQADAAIYFGRDDDTRRLIERLTARRVQGGTRIVAVLGASGSGKSSLVRAGLLPRLKRDKPNWIVLPPFRPQVHPLDELAQAVAIALGAGAAGQVASSQVAPSQAAPSQVAPSQAASSQVAPSQAASSQVAPSQVAPNQVAPPQIASRQIASLQVARGGGADWRHWRDAFAGQDLARTLSGLAGDLHAASGQNEAQILISIDQAEELFGAADKAEAATFMKILNAIEDQNLPFVVVLAMRSDYLGELQKAPGLTAAFEEFSLKPMPRDRVRDIIEGPARVAGLTVDDDLVVAAMNDAATDDALPLLAFALRELYDRFGQSKKLTLEAYRALGDPAAQLSPLENAVRSKADEVLVVAKATPEDLDALREAFVPAMVRVNPEGEYVRRPAALETLPPKARPLLESLARARLLTIEGDGGATTVEVTHEALLRKWPLLRGWLDQEREFLIGIDQLEQNLRDWHAAPAAEKTDALLAGLQLSRARSWLISKPLQLSEDERTFIQASIARQDAEVARRERSRLRVLQASMAASLFLLIIAAGAIWEWHNAQEEKITAQSGNQAGEAERLTGVGGDDALALKTAINAVELRQTQESEFALRTALQAPLEHFILHHQEELRSASFSPDGTRIVTASDDKTARIWDAVSGKLLATLSGHQGALWDAAFSPDGKLIVTASSDKSAIVWDAATGDKSVILKGHSATIETAAFSPDGTRIVTASDDTTANVWDTATGQKVVTLKGDSGGLVKASFSPDGTRILTASLDHLAIEWDAVTGRQLVILKGHTDEVRDAEFSRDGTRIVTASKDMTAIVWDARSGHALETLKGHIDQINTAVFSPDGKLIVTGSDDHTARLWDAQTGALLFSLPGHADYVDQAMFSPDGKIVITASWDRTVRIWKTQTGELLSILMGHNSKINGAAFSPDGKRIVTASQDKTARVWDVGAGETLSTLNGDSSFVFHSDLSPDLSRVVIASADDTLQVKKAEMAAMMAPTAGHANTAVTVFTPDPNQIAAGAYFVRVWNVQTGQAGATLKGHLGLVGRAAFSPDGKRVVTASFDGTARVWDADSGQPLLTLTGHTGIVWDAAFSPDGKRIVTAGADGLAIVWDANSGQRLQTLRGHKGMVLSAVFSPDGTRVTTASQDRTAQVWDINSGKSIATLTGNTWIVYQARFSPDGKRVVAAGSDDSVRVWDIATGKQTLSLAGHTDDVMDATFSPDGTRIVTGSDDHTVRLWNAETGEPLGVLAGSTDWIFSAAFSPDGTHIAAVSWDGTARSYVADLPDLLSWAKKQLPVDSGQ